MSKIDNGGPAFPTEPNTQPGFYLHHGMSLRDWFAGQAMAGILAHNSSVDNRLLEMFGTPGLNRGDVAANVAYLMADAMLEARKVQP